MTMLTRPRPLFRARSPTPPDPKPCVETRSDVESLLDDRVLDEVLCEGVSPLAALIPEISSNVVGGVRIPCMFCKAVLGSSVLGGPPGFDDSVGIDMRCTSFAAVSLGVSGLEVVGTCELRLVK